MNRVYISGVAHALVRAVSRLLSTPVAASGQGVHESAKGAARTARGSRNCFAPHSVLRELVEERGVVRMAAAAAGVIAALVLSSCAKQRPTPDFALKDSTGQ